MPKAANSTYRYEKESAIASTENEARTQAVARIFQTTGNSLGQPVNAAEINKAVQRGTDYSVISSTFNIPINKVCEYSERLADGRYRVYVLCQVAVRGNISVVWAPFKDCNTAAEFNNTTALVKSIFVPGLGQWGKRHFTEGVLTFVGELAFVGTGAACYVMSQDKLDTMKKHGVGYTDFTDARNSYNKLRNTSFVAWGAAATLYAFNLYRAYFSLPNYTDGIALYPTVLPDTKPAIGLGLTYKF
ncbi:MAG: hypothetical protein MJ069_07705 [Salinivirgaceae bacterium]|nr:hypothetical protein [Salinivirgaceae bacterium]